VGGQEQVRARGARGGARRRAEQRAGERDSEEREEGEREGGKRKKKREKEKEKEREREKKRERESRGGIHGGDHGVGRACVPVGDTQRIVRNEGKKEMGRRLNSGVGTAIFREIGSPGGERFLKRVELNNEKILKIIFSA